MQDNQLHMNLTVAEAMKVAANLKLGSHINQAEKDEVVSPILLSFASDRLFKVHNGWMQLFIRIYTIHKHYICKILKLNSKIHLPPLLRYEGIIIY